MEKSIFNNDELYYRPMSPCMCCNSFEKERVREDFNIMCQNIEDIYSLTSPDRKNIFIVKEGKNYYPVVLVKKIDELKNAPTVTKRL
jgi:hypothetical protein